MHGPAVSSALTQLLLEYSNWIGEQIKAADAAVVCVLYAGWVMRCSQQRLLFNTAVNTGLMSR
jgi:hypothetical protein